MTKRKLRELVSWSLLTSGFSAGLPHPGRKLLQLTTTLQDVGVQVQDLGGYTVGSRSLALVHRHCDLYVQYMLTQGVASLLPHIDLHPCCGATKLVEHFRTATSSIQFRLLRRDLHLAVCNPACGCLQGDDASTSGTGAVGVGIGVAKSIAGNR